MLQRARKARWAVVVGCVWAAAVLSGCSGDHEESAAVNPPGRPSGAAALPNIAPSALQQKAFRFSVDSTAADATATVGNLAAVFSLAGLATDQPVTLAFGNFHSTLSAPFTLVAGGFRASGIARRDVSYLLSVQHSTFPPAEAAAENQGLRGPQTGEQIAINLFGSSQDPTRLVLMTDSQNPLRINKPETQSTFQSREICTFSSSGTVHPTPDGCLIVDGTISAQSPGVAGSPTDTLSVTVGQRQTAQVLQFSLTHNPAPVDFDLRIFAVTDAGLVFVQSCLQTTSPEICTVTVPGTQNIASLHINVIGFTGTGDYTLTVLSNQLEGNNTACANVPPTTEVEPNGALLTTSDLDNFFVIDPATQPIVLDTSGGRLQSDGCVRITADLDTFTDVDNDGVPFTAGESIDLIDMYDFSVGSDVETLLFVLTAADPIDNLDLLVFDPDDGSSQDSRGRALAACISDVNPESCAVMITPNSRVRVQVLPFFTDGTDLEFKLGISAPYTLDIRPVRTPIIMSPPPGTLPEPGTTTGRPVKGN